MIKFQMFGKTFDTKFDTRLKYLILNIKIFDLYCFSLAVNIMHLISNSKVFDHQPSQDKWDFLQFYFHSRMYSSVHIVFTFNSSFRARADLEVRTVSSFPTYGLMITKICRISRRRPWWQVVSGYRFRCGKEIERGMR